MSRTNFCFPLNIKQKLSNVRMHSAYIFKDNPLLSSLLWCHHKVYKIKYKEKFIWNTKILHWTVSACLCDGALSTAGRLLVLCWEGVRLDYCTVVLNNKWGFQQLRCMLSYTAIEIHTSCFALVPEEIKFCPHGRQWKTMNYGRNLLWHVSPAYEIKWMRIQNNFSR